MILITIQRVLLLQQVEKSFAAFCIHYSQTYREEIGQTPVHQDGKDYQVRLENTTGHIMGALKFDLIHSMMTAECLVDKRRSDHNKRMTELAKEQVFPSCDCCEKKGFEVLRSLI